MHIPRTGKTVRPPLEDTEMSVSRRELLFAGAALPVTGLWFAARGQEPQIPTASNRNVAAGLSEDPPLAAMLLIEGRKQIANSQVAVRQAQNADVRAFATAEIEEHQRLADRLTARGLQFPTVTPLPAPVGNAAPVDAIPGVPGNPPSEPTANRPVVPQPGTRPAKNAIPAAPAPVTPAPPARSQIGSPVVNVGRMTLPVGESRMITIGMQFADENIASFQKDVAPLSGLAFERAYVGGQLGEHYAFRDMVSVFRRHASPVLMAELDNAAPLIERHIVTLKAMMARLDTNR
jgi:hypothetical protein